MFFQAPTRGAPDSTRGDRRDIALSRWPRLQYLGMDLRLAGVALGLAAGVARGDEAAESLVVGGFESVDEAARAHAYLAGFLLVLLAKARNEEITTTVPYVESMLGDHGTNSGVRPV
jgi:hypothetical protein